MPLAERQRFHVRQAEICYEVFAHHGECSAERLARDVPEFRPAVSLEGGMPPVIEAMDRAGHLSQGQPRRRPGQLEAGCGEKSA